MATYYIRALTRAFKIVECLAAADKPLPVADVSRRVALHRATVHRILVALVQLGYVHKNQKEATYTTGFYLHTFGYIQNIVGRITLHSHVFLEHLAAITGETAQLGALEGTSMVFCDQVPGSDGFGAVKIGARRDAHATAIGKALLAYQPLDDVRQRYEGIHLPRHARRTIVNLEELLRSLAEIKQRGYAIDDEESDGGVRSIAVPIVNPAGRATCAVALVAPAHRFSGERIPAIAKRVIETERAIVEYMVRLEESGYGAARGQVTSRKRPKKPTDMRRNNGLGTKTQLLSR